MSEELLVEAQPVNLEHDLDDGPVERRPLFAGGVLPLLVRPRVPGLDLAAWAGPSRGAIGELLLRHGGLLCRGFKVDQPDDLARFTRAVSGEALEYKERSSPRSAVEGRIYTSTDYPPAYPIFPHNENSYQSSWPLKIFFCCMQPAQAGGETPIADVRRVIDRIDPPVRDRFVAQGWMLVRNFGDGFGLDWRSVFQTSDPAEVESYCGQHGIRAEWKPGGGLRTTTVRPALARHPLTRELLWFNHATFFNVATLEPMIREALLGEFDERDLPSNTFYGDGSPIEPEVLDHLQAAYREETIQFPWQQGDVLLLDNMLVAHARNAYRGERRILVAMSEAVSREA
jgi:alpha-ketoglutarate-dependent taurine dioxygenase